MDAGTRTTAAVMKLWHTMKDDDALRQLAATSPDVALETMGVELPDGIELEYEPDGDEHRVTATGLSGGARSWVFGTNGEMRVEAGGPTGSDELSMDELEAVAGGITQTELDRALDCCWRPGSQWASYCNSKGACSRGEPCQSDYFGAYNLCQ